MRKVVKVCHGHACLRSFSPYIFDRARLELGIENEEGGENIDKSIQLEKCLCQGKCSLGPVVVVEKDSKKELLTQMNPIEISKTIKKLKDTSCSSLF